MAVDDIYALAANFIQDGREWVLGWYYRVSIDDPTKSPVVIATALGADWRTTNWIGEIDQLCSDQVDLVSAFTQMIHPTIEFAVTESFPSSPGQVALPPLPAHTCQLVHQSGLAAGRSFQGRAYLSGIPTSFQDNGKLTALAESEFAAHGATPFGPHTLAPIVASPLRMVNTNYSKKRAADVNPPVFSDLQLASLKPSLATQRGRAITTDIFAP